LDKKNYQFYVTGAVKLGVGYGIVSLLARWVTGNTFLSSPETLMKYGLTGTIGYSLMGSLALIFFGLLAPKIRTKYKEHQTIGDVLQSKLSPSGYWIMITFLFITSLYTIFIQAMGAGILLHLLFPLPIFVGLSIFLLICFLFSGVGGMQWLHTLAGVTVTLVFATVIVIPVYFFIQEGLYPVYDGIKLYHPYLLYFKNYDAIWFTFAAIIIGLGQALTDCATWQRVFIIQKEKIRLTFTLSGVLWATIPLSLSTLVIIVIFGRGYKNIYTILFQLVDKIQSNILIVLFILFCFSAIASALSSSLHAITVIVVRNIIGYFHEQTENNKWKWTHVFSGAVCLILLILISSIPTKPIELLFFSGNIYASIIIPMLYIILSKDPLPTIIPISALIGFISGILFIPIVGNLQSIWISFAVSGFLCFCYLYYTLTFHVKKPF
jgi:Na+/proline symporter